ncbi:MAG: hypothetical protein JWM95_69 [Gemmatimonadetes bacterium]|nr:hypothetical protein [Gemmatimonadota bacterium]
MTKYIRRMSAPLALTFALGLAACASDKPKDSALATDSTLNKDLQLANRDTTAQPALKDVAPTPAASSPAPAATKPKPVAAKPAPKPATPTTSTTATGNTVTKNPTPAAGGGAVGTIASGTSIGLRSNARVCTNTYTVGQTFDATVTDGVTGSNGATIPAGATVALEVTQLKRSENSTDKVVMEFAVKSVSFSGHTYPLSASVTNAVVTKVRNEPQGKDVQKVVGGAVLGAIAGKILGKSTKATVIGGAAGAAAGAGVAAGTANYEGCINDGAGIAITLNGPLQVKIA